MADEDGFKPDVPRGSSLAVRTPDEARALARRMAGEPEHDRCRFACVMCGWDKTLHFDEDECAALGGDIRSYGGPCQGCNSMTLQPWDTIEHGAFKSIHEMVSTNRKKEYGEAADVFIEKVKANVGNMMSGVVPGSTLDPDPAPSAGPSRDHLPDADGVDLSEMKPRKG
jgi:hypothetical protein